MAIILEFRASRADAPKPQHRNGPSPSGEIVIFPGIRYEPWPETAPAAAGEAQSKQALRDVLKLVE